MSADRDRRIDVYIEKSRWPDQIAALREIALAAGLTEAFKWRQPCYRWQGRNLALIFGMKDCCGISFFRGILLDDPDGLLRVPGPNSRSVRQMVFTDTDEIAAAEARLRDFLAQTIAQYEAGEMITLAQDDLPWPEELIARFETDPKLRDAFTALTPGRQRGWLLLFSEAKQSATRAARIERAADAIRAGQGRHDR